MSNPFRAACLTIFQVENYYELPDGLQYLAYGHETCPTTGNPHLQAWAYSTRGKRLSAWKKIFPTAHITQMRGTFAENDTYCSKEGTLTEFGEKPMENGKKRSLEALVCEVTEGAQQGKPLRDIIMEGDQQATFVQYHNGISKIHAMAVNYKLSRIDKNFAPEVIYVHGEPGSGKSRWVREQDPDVYDVPQDDSYKWKDGYSGQEAVVYENVSVANVKSPERLLKEIDRYFIQVPVKGGFTGWRPKRIYITTVHELQDFADHAGFSKPSEFTRRITQVKCMDTPDGIYPSGVITSGRPQN